MMSYPYVFRSFCVTFMKVFALHSLAVILLSIVATNSVDCDCASDALNREDYRVSFKDAFNVGDEMYAGYMPIKLEPQTNREGSFFFWLAKQRKSSNYQSSDRKLVIWLNGGPGCSSMVGMMWENGPFTIHDDSEGVGYVLENNPYSWNEAADVLFVEQPIRTGFSPAASNARRIQKGVEVGADFHSFLKSFLTVFDDLKDAHVYLTGESYAGFYIPWIAHHIVHSQLNMIPSTPGYIHIKGVAIGNGAIDDVIQEASYTEYAYTHGLIPLGAKQLIDDIYNRCIENNAARVPHVNDDSEPSSCESMSLVLDAAGHPNEYNTATFRGYDHIIKPNGPFHRFFNDPKIQELLHVRGYDIPGINFSPEFELTKKASEYANSSYYYAPEGWEVCNDNINEDLRGGHPLSCVPAIQFLIKHIKVLLYSGENDLNTNFLGTLHTLQAHLWYDTKRFSSADRSLWKFKDDVAGEYHSMDKLAFLVVRNSGHLLPMDLPDVALDMLDRFLNDKSFQDVPLPSEEDYVKQFLLLNSTRESKPLSNVWMNAGIATLVGSIVLYLLIRYKQRQSKARIPMPLNANDAYFGVDTSPITKNSRIQPVDLSRDHSESGVEMPASHFWQWNVIQGQRAGYQAI